MFKLDSGMTIGATAHTFTVLGDINGSVGYDAFGVPFSRANVTYTSIKDDTGGETSTLSVDPQNHLPALEVATVIAGNPVDIYLDEDQSKPIPGDVITHTGFLVSGSVPEPGTIALMIGMSVGAGSLLRKRRRS
jgi:3D (Asp-Asp-Asp) domain-containing protein